MSEQDKRAEDEYVAWLRYTESATPNLSAIRVCDSDTPGAFKVYRAGALAQARREGVEAIRDAAIADWSPGIVYSRWTAKMWLRGLADRLSKGGTNG